MSLSRKAGGNGCSCRWCVYDRTFAAEIVKVPEEARAFFEQLKEDWEAEAHDASYWRNYWADEVASVDTHAKRGDSTQIEAPSPMGSAVVATGDETPND